MTTPQTIEISKLRNWLVTHKDNDRQAMLSGSETQARYYAGRVDALRDALQFIAEARP